MSRQQQQRSMKLTLSTGAHHNPNQLPIFFHIRKVKSESIDKIANGKVPFSGELIPTSFGWSYEVPFVCHLNDVIWTVMEITPSPPLMAHNLLQLII